MVQGSGHAHDRCALYIYIYSYPHLEVLILMDVDVGVHDLPPARRQAQEISDRLRHQQHNCMSCDIGRRSPLIVLGIVIVILILIVTVI